MTGTRPAANNGFDKEKTLSDWVYRSNSAWNSKGINPEKKIKKHHRTMTEATYGETGDKISRNEKRKSKRRHRNSSLTCKEYKGRLP